MLVILKSLDSAAMPFKLLHTECPCHCKQSFVNRWLLSQQVIVTIVICMLQLSILTPELVCVSTTQLYYYAISVNKLE